VIRVDRDGPFQFKAGQHATLWVDHEDKMIERAYSIVFSPYEQGLEFFIELVPQGELTPQDYDLFKIGWSHLGNPGVVVGSKARFLLQDMNLAFHLRHLMV
jgi:NAD(P)H-flavin reductase